MSIGKIELNFYNIYPDNFKKDSERKLSQDVENKVNDRKFTNEIQDIHQHEKGYNVEKIQKEIYKIDEIIKDYISHVKSQMPSSNKFYPPYPPGSEDRTRLLKNFLLFKEQIAQFSLEQNNIENNIQEEDRIQELKAEIKSMEIKKFFSDSNSYKITLNHSELLGLT